jgi:hypothetical protein
MSMSDGATPRDVLLYALAKFIRAAVKVSGVVRIAVVGSLTTDKLLPKDADVLVTLRDDADIETLSMLGRRLKGSLQGHNLGADIFLAVQSGQYIGRTCSFKACHPRRACGGSKCRSGNRICDDLRVVSLPDQLIAEPPLVVWPQVTIRGPLPADTRKILIGDHHHGIEAKWLRDAAGANNLFDRTQQT